MVYRTFSVEFEVNTTQSINPLLVLLSPFQTHFIIYKCVSKCGSIYNIGLYNNINVGFPAAIKGNLFLDPNINISII